MQDNDEHDRLKQEYLKLRQQNNDLLKIREYRRQRRTNQHQLGGPKRRLYEVEERDILNQLQDELLQLRQDINDSTPSASEYKL